MAELDWKNVSAEMPNLPNLSNIWDNAFSSLNAVMEKAKKERIQANSLEAMKTIFGTTNPEELRKSLPGLIDSYGSEIDPDVLRQGSMQVSQLLAREADARQENRSIESHNQNLMNARNSEERASTNFARGTEEYSRNQRILSNRDTYIPIELHAINLAREGKQEEARAYLDNYAKTHDTTGIDITRFPEIIDQAIKAGKDNKEFNDDLAARTEVDKAFAGIRNTYVDYDSALKSLTPEQKSNPYFLREFDRRVKPYYDHTDIKTDPKYLDSDKAIRGNTSAEGGTSLTVRSVNRSDGNAPITINLSPDQAYLANRFGHEAGLKYDNVNDAGYLGLNQSGMAYLNRAGVYTPGPGEDLNSKQQTWKGTFTNPFTGEKITKEQYLADPKLQLDVTKLMDDKIWDNVKKAGLDTQVGTVRKDKNGNDFVITKAGILMGANLGGDTGVINYLKNGTDVKDSNGTYISDWVRNGSKGTQTRDLSDSTNARISADTSDASKRAAAQYNMGYDAGNGVFLSGSFMRDFGRATYDSAERDKTKDDILKELFKSEGTDKTDTDWYNIFQSNDIDRESYIKQLNKLVDSKGLSPAQAGAALRESLKEGGGFDYDRLDAIVGTVKGKDGESSKLLSKTQYYKELDEQNKAIEESQKKLNDAREKLIDGQSKKAIVTGYDTSTLEKNYDTALKAHEDNIVKLKTYIPKQETREVPLEREDSVSNKIDTLLGPRNTTMNLVDPSFDTQSDAILLDLLLKRMNK